MDSRNLNWYSLNSTRAYPLDDRATRTGDAGERLPNDVLVDLNLRFPNTVGSYVWLSSLAVTKTLVTATFLASTDPAVGPPVFAPLGVVTARKPLQAGRHYPIEGLIEGVGGWIVFGDVDEVFSGRFSTPAQGLILPRCARSYAVPPVRSIGKVDVATALSDVVLLKSGSDIEIVKGDRFVDGLLREVIVIRLNSFSGGRNVFDLYKGPCGTRPETNNCDRLGVEFINTVGPDCNGNLQIVFGGDALIGAYPGSSEGMVIDFPIGLAEACTTKDRLPDAHGVLPNEYDDTCTSEYEGQQANSEQGDVDHVGEDPPVFNIPTVSSEPADCAELPYTEAFDDQNAQDFRVLFGAFGFVEGDSPDTLDEAPGTHEDCWPVGSSSSCVDVPDTRHSYISQSTHTRNVSVWDNCGTESTLNLRGRTDMRMQSGGAKQNGGLILNYHTVGTSSPHDEYHIAEVDLATDSIRLRRWNGASFITEGEAAGVGLKVGDWYRITATAVPGTGDTVLVEVTLEGVTDPSVFASFTASVSSYLPGNGRFGVGTDQAISEFSYLYIENA